MSKDVTKIFALIGSILALFVLVARLGFSHGETNERLEGARERVRKNEADILRIERANLDAHSKMIETLGRIEERIKALR